MKLIFHSYKEGNRGSANYIFRSNPKKLTLKIYGKSEKDIKLGSLIDLKDLEKFILTGK
jgi:hypothetical protein